MIAFVFSFGLLNAILGVLCYFLPSSYEWYGTYYFALAATSLILYLIHFRWSLLFQARMLLLSVIGYFAGLVKAIDPLLFFSPVETAAQTLEVGAKMFGLTSVALFGSFLGLSFGFKHRFLKNNYAILPLVKGRAKWSAIYYLSLIFIFVTGYLSSLSYGPTIFEGVYGVGEGQGQALGNLQSIGVVFVILNIAASQKYSSVIYRNISILAILYFFVWGIFIRGGRLEVASGVLAIVICIPLLKGKITNVSLKQIIYIIFAALLMESWGWLRSALFSTDSETLIENYARLAESGVYFAGTVSGIASSFANTLHMFDNNLISAIWGISYFEYLPRTPPEFLYPGRPSDYSSLFQIYGYASIGGFFELAEAYLNFGIFGCFLIPMLISFGLSRIYQMAFKGDLFWFLILSAILSVFFRGAWYQSFAFYKSLFTGLVIYVLVVLVVSLLGLHMSRIKSLDNLVPRSAK